jgi:hypothetical protein
MAKKLFALAAFVAVTFLSTAAWSGAFTAPVHTTGPEAAACCPDGSCCPDGPCCAAATESCCPLGICCPGGPCCDAAAVSPKATCCPEGACCADGACCASK